jgi:hypothetical protein
MRVAMMMDALAARLGLDGTDSSWRAASRPGTSQSPGLLERSRTTGTVGARALTRPVTHLTHRIGVSVLLDKVQGALALGGRRRKAGQSGRAGPDAPLAPHLAELHKPTQVLISVHFAAHVL